MRRDPVPAYYRIYQVLSERIATGAYKLGSQLPTDAELMAEFGVSRHTARARRWKSWCRASWCGASRVAAPSCWKAIRRSRDWSARALEDLRIHDPDARFDLHGIDRLPPHARRSSGGAAAGAGEPRASCASHGAACGRPDRSPSARPTCRRSWRRDCRADIAEQMRSAQVIPLIEKYCGVQAFRVQQASSAIAADAELARRLKVEVGAPLLLLQRTYFDIQGTPIYYSDLYVRSDRFVHKIELFRHRQQVESGASRCRPARAAPTIIVA